jgi:hypothetical protein
MNRRASTLNMGMGLMAMCFAVIGCSLLGETIGDLRTDNQTIDLDSATSARVEIEFPAGELTVGSGLQGLMDATFRYNVDRWEPNVDYSISGSQGDLKLSQPGVQRFTSGRTVNSWAIQLFKDVPLELSISTGAGKSDLNLSELLLEGLQVETGAGEVTIDLSGNWEHDLDVSINGGVGKITVFLPSEMGVRVSVANGLGSITTDGLTKQGDEYVNGAFGRSAYTLRLKIEVGVGSVTLQVVE